MASYRLTQAHQSYGAYGKLLTEEEFARIPWFDKALCEPYVSIKDFDFTVYHYQDGKEIPGRSYAFYEDEIEEMATAKLGVNKVYTVSNFEKLSGNPLNGNCIVVIKKQKQLK